VGEQIANVSRQVALSFTVLLQDSSYYWIVSLRKKSSFLIPVEGYVGVGQSIVENGHRVLKVFLM
jgi:hypothetical protein